MSEITLEMALGLPRITTVESVGGILCHICRQTYCNKKLYDGHYMFHCNDKTKIKYTCVACEKTYSGYPTFRSHCYVQHILKDKFKCSHCSKCFPKISFLKDHVDSVHNFHCPFNSCNKTFTSKPELHQHQLVHKSACHKPPYGCRGCGETINTPDDCEQHIDSHCTLTHYCPICQIEVNKENAEKHLTEHFQNENSNQTQAPLKPEDKQIETPEDSSIKIIGGIACCQCKLNFGDRTEFDLHFKAEHKGEDLFYTCIVCGKQYEKYSLFGDHCYSHCSRTKFECEKCAKSFPRLSILVAHNEAYHSMKKEGKPFGCAYCERKFTSEKKMQEHTRAKHDDCDFKCTEPGCDSTFDTPKELLLHRKRHSSFNWCRTCGMQFPTLASCYKHLDIHKKKLFSCPVCSKAMSEKHYIMKHIPKHFATTFFVCKICSKVYNEKRRLIQHTKIHAHVKKYRCSTCGKGFARSSHLKQHINVHSGAKPYTCVACPKTFASYPNWNKHLKRMHNIDAKTLKKPQITNEVDMKLDETFCIDDIVNEFDDDSMDSDSDSTIGDEINALETYLFDSADNLVPDENCNTSIAEKASSQDGDLCLDISELTPETESQILEGLLDVGVFPEAPSQPIPVEAPPTEYGPEFCNFDQTITAETPGEYINLDDYFLPHIDPLLTIKSDSTPTVNQKTDTKWIQDPYYNISTTEANPMEWGSNAYPCFNTEMSVFRSSVV